MATLKERATKKSSSPKKGTLSAKAEQKASSSSNPEIVDGTEEMVEPKPNVSSGSNYYQAPPLPAPLAYLKYLATVPGLRGKPM